MIKWIKRIVHRYDNWCESMGLTPQQKPCCVPVSKEDIFDKKDNLNTENRLNEKESVDE